MKGGLKPHPLVLGMFAVALVLGTFAIGLYLYEWPFGAFGKAEVPCCPSLVPRSKDCYCRQIVLNEWAKFC